jgi:alpha-beta hydrolase superfamily lysophospholipase
MLTTETPPQDVQLISPDGLRLHALSWARPNPRGILVIAHGFGEYSGCYKHVAEALGPALDIDVLAPDYRGHGRSPGRRGVVRHYDELLGDFQSALDWAERERPGLPCFVLGHSNGGQLVLRLMLQTRSAIAGLILSNPALRVAFPVPKYKIWIGHALLRIAPWVTLGASVEPDKLTRDPAMQEEHRVDPLRHCQISAPLFFGMVEGGEIIAARADELRMPILMILGSDDPIIDPRESQRVFERFGSTDKTLIVYPGMLHEPLNDLGREQVFNDIIQWIERRLETLSPLA